MGKETGSVMNKVTPDHKTLRLEDFTAKFYQAIIGELTSVLKLQNIKMKNTFLTQSVRSVLLNTQIRKGHN